MKKLLYILLLLPALVRGQMIITVAGGGTGGNGIPATASGLSQPHGLAIDDTGNLYICDLGNAQLKKVRPAYPGIINVIAGNGIVGYGGDGGLAIDASFRTVHAVVLDRKGNIYIADPDDNRIRKVTTDGHIYTFAGTGAAGYNGDGILATTANLNNPLDIVADDTGNIYISDAGNFRLRKIDTAGIITTIAGTGIPGFTADGSLVDTSMINSLYGITIDQHQNIFFRDNGRIRKFNMLAKAITTIAGNGLTGTGGDGGMATAATISSGQIVLDTGGNLLITDGYSHRIRKIGLDGIISTIAGSGIGGFSGDWGDATIAMMNTPVGIAADPNGDIYISDMGNWRVRMITDKEVGIKELSETEFSIDIIPNPTYDACKVLVKTLVEETLIISLTDLDGKEMLRLYGFTNCPMELPTKLPRGIYIVAAIAGNRKATKKLIIE